MNQNKSRRQFMKGVLGGFGMVIADRVRWLFPEGKALANQTHNQNTIAFEEESGELYEGFLILPNIDSPFSSQEGTLTGQREVTEFETLLEAMDHFDIPLFLPSSIPNGLEVTKVSLQRYTTSLKPHLVTVSYSSSEAKNQPSVISIAALSIFPQPYPVRPVHLFRNGAKPELVSPERVSFSPTPGVMLPSIGGYGLHWIEEDVLYTFVEEYTADRDSVVNLVRSLRKNI